MDTPPERVTPVRRGGKRTAELVLRLVELGARELAEQLKVPEPQARELMREIAHNLARHYGGQFMYVPKDQEFALTKRDLLIFERFNGSNVQELALEHGLTARQVYAILGHVRDQQLRKLQGELPGFDDDADPA